MRGIQDDMRIVGRTTIEPTRSVLMIVSAVALFSACHSPQNPEEELPLRELRNLELASVEVRLDVEGVATSPPELKWFSRLITDSAFCELGRAQSFELLESSTTSNKMEQERTAARLSLTYTLSDRTLKDHRLLANRVVGEVTMPDGESYRFSEKQEINYQGELERRRILEGKALPSTNEFVREVFGARLSEQQWVDILSWERKKKAKTTLPDPSQEFASLLEHRVKVARGQEKLGWVESARTADWGRPGQWSAAGSSFLLFCASWLGAFVILIVSEKVFGSRESKQDQPGALIVVVLTLSGLYFLYLSCAAIF